MADNFEQDAIVPVYCEHASFGAQPMPVVIHPGKKASHWLSVVAVVLCLHSRATHEVVIVAVAIFEHFTAPLVPTKLLHSAAVPE